MEVCHTKNGPHSLPCLILLFSVAGLKILVTKSLVPGLCVSEFESLSGEEQHVKPLHQLLAVSIGQSPRLATCTAHVTGYQCTVTKLRSKHLLPGRDGAILFLFLFLFDF